MDKWSRQEDQIVKFLARRNKPKDWNQIAQQLKLKYEESNKTGKECKQRYLMLVNQEKKMKKENEWSPQELKMLIDLFLKYGLRWTYLTKFFPSRTENCIKNKFYNSLRKSARKLMDAQSKKIGSSCKSVLTCQMLTIILELCHELVTMSENKKIKISLNSNIFQVRNRILETSFVNEEDFDEEKAYQLVKDIRKLNSNLRCFGVYKTKKRKKWNLNPEKLQSVLKVIKLEDEQPIKNQFEVEQKMQKQIVNPPQEPQKQVFKMGQSELLVPVSYYNPYISVEMGNEWMNLVQIQNQISAQFYWSHMNTYFNNLLKNAEVEREIGAVKNQELEPKSVEIIEDNYDQVKMEQKHWPSHPYYGSNQKVFENSNLATTQSYKNRNGRENEVHNRSERKEISKMEQKNSVFEYFPNN